MKQARRKKLPGNYHKAVSLDDGHGSRLCMSSDVHVMTSSLALKLTLTL